MKSPQRTLLMFSAGPGEISLESHWRYGSLFASMLAPLLRKDGLTVHELASDVRASVRTLAKATPHVQTPVYENTIGEEVCLAANPCGTRKDRRPEYGSLARVGHAEEAWEKIRDTPSVAALEAYIEAFKDTYSQVGSFWG
jgi:hypothetical protein